MRRVRTHTLTALAALAIAIGSSAAYAQKHTPLSDQQIQAQVEHKLSEKDIVGVKVAVRDGVVTLTGNVPSVWAKQETIEQAGKVDDVRSVVSELTVARGESDKIIGEEIARKVRRYVFYTIYDDIDINVQNGVVTLTGRVTQPYKTKEIADLAGRVAGVVDVKNEIATLPVSIFDDQLRASIASQIYRDPLFWNYAIQVNPPIHIIVENSRVTLTGVVATELEKRKAEIIARSTFGVLGVENKLRVER